MLSLLVACLLPLDAPPELPSRSPEYPLMGEYLSITENGSHQVAPASRDREPTVGLQVRPVPDVDGKAAYEFVSHFGGLPGAGWTGITPTRRTVTADEAGESLQRFFRVQRSSPTLHQPPPRGAVVLFDAANPSLEAWKDGATLKDGYLKSGATTRSTFRGQQIHLEFWIPLQVEKLDTWRGNSGVYVQDRYEVQVLESFGDVIRENGSGSIYRLHTPPQNMALPPMQWQTLDITLQPATFAQEVKSGDAVMSVSLNGVPLFEEVTVPSVTNGNHLEESSYGGPLHLQDHGDPVLYRNIWLKRLP